MFLLFPCDLFVSLKTGLSTNASKQEKHPEPVNSMVLRVDFDSL